MRRYYFATAVADVVIPTGIQYASDFIAAAGITNSTQISALNQLESALKATGWLSNESRELSRLKAAYPVVGGTATKHSWNFVNPAANQLTYGGSPGHDAGGMHFDGLSQYADTQFIAESLSKGDNHLSYYAADTTLDPNSSGQGVMGTAVDGTSALCLAVNRGNLAFHNVGSAIALYTQPAPVAGLTLGTATDSTTIKLYQAGVEVATSTGTIGGELSAATITLGRVNVNGQYSRIPCSFATIGLGGNATQAHDLYMAIQQFQTTLGRAR